jgi:F0F1-type ATP synthase membrane subunit c/vacuolar-type H+-ATPase subunit K
MDPLLGLVLSVGVAGIGCTIAAVSMWTAFRMELNEIADEEERKKMDEEFRPKTIVSMVLPTTTVVFSLVIFMIAQSKALITEDFFYFICTNIGISGFIVSVAEGYYVRGTTKQVFENPEHWGKSISNLTLCELPILFVLVIAFTSLSKVTGNDADLFWPNRIVMIGSTGSLVSAALMLRYELKDFQKAMLVGLFGTSISLVSFLLAYMYLV